MTTWDDLIALAAFAAGFAVGAATWWILRRSPHRAAAGPPPPPESATARTGNPGVAAAPPDPRKPRSTAERGALRTSQRVVLYLASQPRLTYGEVAPAGLTQAGMARSLAVAQPALARVLGRLIDGEAILEMRTHVSGSSRRLKVYQLTVHGEAIARDLRRQQASARAGPVPGSTTRAVTPTAPSLEPPAAET